MTYFNIGYYSGFRLELFNKTVKTSAEIDGNPDEIQTGYHLNTSLNCYRYMFSICS
jgi:hypothetical protein